MTAALRRIALGLALSVVAATLLLTRGDGPPPDDADLMATAAPIPAHDNGYLTLQAAGELVQWPDDPAQESRLVAMLEGRAWDDEVAARVLGANELALRAYERLPRNRAFQSPVDPIHAPSVYEGLELARLVELRAVAAGRRGDLEAAIEDALLAMRAGKKVGEDPNGGALSSAAGFAAGRSGLRALEAVLARIPLVASRCLALSRALGAQRSDPEAWRGALAAEYRRQRAHFLGSAISGIGEHAVEDRLGAAERVARWLPRRYVLQPNNSLRFLAAQVRLRQARADQPCSAGASALPPLSLAELLRPNALGRRAVMRESQLEATELQRCDYDARIELTRAAFGVLSFESERGVLPPSLEALAPTYLESPPLDPFSGSVLHFDRARRLIYSVGSDGLDESGRELPASDVARELRIVIPELARD